MGVEDYLGRKKLREVPKKKDNNQFSVFRSFFNGLVRVVCGQGGRENKNEKKELLDLKLKYKKLQEQLKTVSRLAELYKEWRKAPLKDKNDQKGQKTVRLKSIRDKNVVLREIEQELEDHTWLQGLRVGVSSDRVSDYLTVLEHYEKSIERQTRMLSVKIRRFQGEKKD